MNYFQVAFDYLSSGVYRSSHREGDEHLEHGSRVLTKAETALVAVLVKEGYNFKHAYAWPDGSLYKFFRTEDNESEFTAKLKRVLESIRIGISRVYVQDPLEDPRKYNFTTLEDFMNDKLIIEPPKPSNRKTRRARCSVRK